MHSLMNLSAFARDGILQPNAVVIFRQRPDAGSEQNGDQMMATTKNTSKEPVTLGEDDMTAIKQAIAEGRSLIEQGKTKVEASMAIYSAMKGYPQETVVSAMIDGAGLTPKGALTYWYNCRRKFMNDISSENIQK